MMRLHDWQTRFAALVAERWAQPFEWGTRDCCLWAADAVQAITGQDLAADLRGTYADLRGGLRTIAAVGGLPALCTSRLGPQILPAQAQPGDVGLVDEGEAFHALVVQAGGHWLGQGADGLRPVRPDQVLMAWRCTHG
jgi:hypothetical protein